MTLTRDTILTTAGDLINGQRDKDYGDPFDSFTRIGTIWGAILETPPIPPEKVGLLLAGLKFSRLVTAPLHEDSYVDAAGYIALAGEAAGRSTRLANLQSIVNDLENSKVSQP